MQKHNSPIKRPAHQCNVQAAAFTHIDTKIYLTVSLFTCHTAQLYRRTDTSLELATSIFRVNTEDRDSKFLWNIIIHLRGYSKSWQYLNMHWHKNVTSYTP